MHTAGQVTEPRLVTARHDHELSVGHERSTGPRSRGALVVKSSLPHRTVTGWRIRANSSSRSTYRAARLHPHCQEPSIQVCDAELHKYYTGGAAAASGVVVRDWPPDGSVPVRQR